MVSRMDGSGRPAGRCRIDPGKASPELNQSSGQVGFKGTGKDLACSPSMGHGGEG